MITLDADDLGVTGSVARVPELELDEAVLDRLWRLHLNVLTLARHLYLGDRRLCLAPIAGRESSERG